MARSYERATPAAAVCCPHMICDHFDESEDPQRPCSLCSCKGLVQKKKSPVTFVEMSQPPEAR